MMRRGSILFPSFSLSYPSSTSAELKNAFSPAESPADISVDVPIDAVFIARFFFFFVTRAGEESACGASAMVCKMDEVVP